jgi:tRNA nucleotidyltransferase (CCA-adding enzyme)
VRDLSPKLCYNERLMIKHENIKEIIETQLPSELVQFLQLSGRAAAQMGHKLYLVGGVVRDLLLERSNTDLDLVIEGDAIDFAVELAKSLNAKVIAHSHFRTAKIKLERRTIDIATARTESYVRPGGLPTLEAKTDILGDLRRRDFTINSMAVRLDAESFGQIIDIFGGRKDLAAGIIRVLHEKSFQDDATRIWRAARYEQRLRFKIEHQTESFIHRDMAYLDTLSSDRLRNELELCLEEDQPEKVLLRASELGILAQIMPAWKISSQTVHSLKKARSLVQPYTPPQEIYLAILLFGLGQPELEGLIKHFNFGRSVVTTLQDSLALQVTFSAISEPGLSNGQIYHLLNKISANALMANLVILDSGVIKSRIELYLNQLRQVKTALTGDDLIKAGFAPGPVIGETLEKLKEAKLEGRVVSVEDERELIKRIGQVE